MLSSDGNGAPPREENREGQPARANYMPVDALQAVWRQLVEQGLAPDNALRVVTSNVAAARSLARKGSLAPGQDADLNLFDPDWRLQMVLARGRIVVEHGQPLARGMFDAIIQAELA